MLTSRYYVFAGICALTHFDNPLGVNWTSTTIPLWQIDCENFRKVGTEFELRDVKTTEHRQFVELFSARYDIAVEHGDGVAIFHPEKPHKEEGADRD